MDPSLYTQLKEFDDWKVRLFSLALAERMFPNFELFSRVTESADADKVRTALDLMWDSLCQRAKLNPEAQLERVDACIPNVEDYDMYGVYPALDAVVAVCSALNQFEKASVDEAMSICQLSEECVATYLEVSAPAELSDEQLERHITTHELMDDEWLFCETLLASLNGMKSQQASAIDELRIYAENQGVSNIGICNDD